MAGLSASVEVLRDERGVPTIYADTLDDLMFAQGYVHAQDRFYEMDVRRHVTAGRLSEMFGASQVATDSFLRTMGWRRVADQEIALLSDTSLQILDAYANGVNAYLADRPAADVSLEYSVLGLINPSYEIEPKNYFRPIPSNAINRSSSRATSQSRLRRRPFALSQFQRRLCPL